jgi:integrase
MRHVKSMLLWADEWEVCDNPVRKFPRLSQAPTPTRRFSDEEVALLLARMPTDGFRDMVVFGLLTGMRPQELRVLAKRHVQSDAHSSRRIVMDRHKTARSQRQPAARVVPLCEHAAEILDRQLQEHPDGPTVFLNDDGQPYTGLAFRQRFERWCGRAGVERKPPYALRHTFASLVAEQRVNSINLSRLLGHTTARTAERYVAGSDQHMQEIVEASSDRILRLVPAESVEAEIGKKVATKVATKDLEGLGAESGTVETGWERTA